jgi:hypothetical protein
MTYFSKEYVNGIIFIILNKMERERWQKITGEVVNGSHHIFKGLITLIFKKIKL